MFELDRENQRFRNASAATPHMLYA